MTRKEETAKRGHSTDIRVTQEQPVSIGNFDAGEMSATDSRMGLNKTQGWAGEGSLSDSLPKGNRTSFTNQSQSRRPNQVFINRGPVRMNNEAIRPLNLDIVPPSRRTGANEGDTGPLGRSEGKQPQETQSAPNNTGGNGDMFSKTGNILSMAVFGSGAKSRNLDRV
eukprot:scaffold19645_cov69-Cylindrotheca_fusiformis.AAC.1